MSIEKRSAPGAAHVRLDERPTSSGRGATSGRDGLAISFRAQPARISYTPALRTEARFVQKTRAVGAVHVRQCHARARWRLQLMAVDRPQAWANQWSTRCCVTTSPRLPETCAGPILCCAPPVHAHWCAHRRAHRLRLFAARYAPPRRCTDRRGAAHLDAWRRAAAAGLPSGTSWQ